MFENIFLNKQHWKKETFFLDWSLLWRFTVVMLRCLMLRLKASRKEKCWSNWRNSFQFLMLFLFRVFEQYNKGAVYLVLLTACLRRNVKRKGISSHYGERNIMNQQPKKSNNTTNWNSIRKIWKILARMQRQVVSWSRGKYLTLRACYDATQLRIPNTINSLVRI